MKIAVQTPKEQIRRPPPAVSHDHWWRCLFAESEGAQLACRMDGTIVEANKKALQLFSLDPNLAGGAQSFF